MNQTSAVPVRRRSAPRLVVVLFFLFGHALLGITMKHFAILATVHALLAVSVGLYYAVTAKRVARAVMVVSYLMGAEVLWRMADAGVFWEYGKYACSAILILWGARHHVRRTNWLAVIYFVLLTPAIVLTCLQISGFEELKQAISANLSGPLLLMIAAFYLNGSSLRELDLQFILLALIGPIVGVAAICTFSTLQLEKSFEFTLNSNFATSGGFGPNQVSAMLGIGMLAAFFWSQIPGGRLSQRVVGVGLVLYFFAQAALTFSRTGVYLGVGCICVAALFLVHNPRKLLSALTALAILFLAGYFLIFPALDRFTNGMLTARFAQKGFAGREDIAKAEIQVGLNHPLLGCGVGLVRLVRLRETGIGGPSHTEFTRLVAEHGVLGLVAIVSLLVMGVRTCIATTTRFQRAWSASLVTYAVLFMLVSAMRLAVPSVIMGLAMVQLRPSFARTRSSRLGGSVGLRRRSGSYHAKTVQTTILRELPINFSEKTPSAQRIISQ